MLYTCSDTYEQESLTVPITLRLKYVLSYLVAWLHWIVYVVVSFVLHFRCTPNFNINNLDPLIPFNLVLFCLLLTGCIRASFRLARRQNQLFVGSWCKLSQQEVRPGAARYLWIRNIRRQQVSREGNEWENQGRIRIVGTMGVY